MASQSLSLTIFLTASTTTSTRNITWHTTCEHIGTHTTTIYTVDHPSLLCIYKGTPNGQLASMSKSFLLLFFFPSAPDCTTFLKFSPYLQGETRSCCYHLHAQAKILTRVGGGGGDLIFFNFFFFFFFFFFFYYSFSSYFFLNIYNFLFVWIIRLQMYGLHMQGSVYIYIYIYISVFIRGGL